MILGLPLLGSFSYFHQRTKILKFARVSIKNPVYPATYTRLLIQLYEIKTIPYSKKEIGVLNNI